VRGGESAPTRPRLGISTPGHSFCETGGRIGEVKGNRPPDVMSARSRSLVVKSHKHHLDSFLWSRREVGDWMAAARNHRYLIPKALPVESVRPRLLARAKSNQDLSLIALIAPSGYGKTTLMAQHARSFEGPKAWISLSENEADPVRIASTLLGCALQSIADFSTSDWDAANMTATGPHAEALAQDFNRLSQPGCLYLDGVEVLGPSAGAWLERFLEGLATGWQMWISSVTDPPLPLAKSMAAGKTLCLGQEDLSFTFEETRTWFDEQHCPLEAHKLQRELEGWAAGLALAMRQGSGGLHPKDLIIEAINRLDPSLIASMAELAVLDVWSNNSLQAVGLHWPEGWPDGVRQLGLPITPLPDGSFRAHKVLSDALEVKLKRNPERHRELHRRVAQLAESEKNPFVALKHYHLADDHEQMMRLAESLSVRYEQRWEPWLVRKTLEPLEGHLNQPLRRALAHALLETGEADRGEVMLLDLARSGFRGAYMSFSLGVLALHQGKIEAVLSHAETGLLEPDAGPHQTMLLRLKAAALANLERHKDGLEVAQSAVRVAEERNDLVELGNALTMVEKIETFLNRYIAAEHVINRALGIFEGLGALNQQLVLLEDLCWLHYRQGKLESALTLANRAVKLAEHEFLYMKPTVLSARADVLFLSNDLLGAERDLIEALRLCPEFQMDSIKRPLWSRLAETRLLLGQHRAASEAFEWAIIVPEFAAMDTYQVYRMCLALFALEEGNLQEARTEFSTVLTNTLNPHQAVRARAYLLEVDRREKVLRPEAVEALVRAIEDLGLNPLATDFAKLQGLREACAERGWLFPTPASFEVPPSKPLLLSIGSIGELVVKINTKAIHLPLTRSGELLIYLAVHGRCSRAQIINALWEGSNDHRHVEYFKVALKQLRAALAGQGQVEFPPIPITAGLYQLADEFRVDFDLNHLRRAIKEKRPELMQHLLNGPVAVFLPETASEWAETVRRSVAEDLVEVAMMQAQRLEVDDPSAALEALQRATEIEPLADQAWFQMIRFHLTRGDVEKAKHILGRAQRVREQLGFDQTNFYQDGLALFNSSPILPLEQ
jgi:LuxR family transcriptional regulator, maltose regulon positive regulatory protein